MCPRGMAISRCFGLSLELVQEHSACVKNIGQRSTKRSGAESDRFWRFRDAFHGAEEVSVTASWLWTSKIRGFPLGAHLLVGPI